MKYMASSWRSRGVKAEDGRVDVTDYIRLQGYNSLLLGPINRTLGG
jgi:hypothetical protein